MNTAASFDADLQVKPLEALIQELPADLRSEVRNFVEFLLAKRMYAVRQPLRKDWANAQHTPREENKTISLTTFPLRGTVLRYDAPFDPVAEAEWEALQ